MSPTEQPTEPPTEQPTKNPASIRIAITGASGLLGRRLREEWPNATFFPLVRDRAREGIYWQPGEGSGGAIDAAALEGMDVVIHLAGEPILGRWTPAKRKRIHDSRERGTTLLCETLAGLERKPKVLLCASAIGIYDPPEQIDEVIDENTDVGSNFLAEVCRAWEAATASAEAAGIRVCHMRIGIVLSGQGGALKQMLLPFKLGLGGRVGHGRQYMSWISIEDIAGAARFLVENESARGAFNFTAPEPVTNLAFTKTLGSVLRRPTIFPVPAFVLRMIYGEMSDALLLASLRIEPTRLTEAGYAFRQPQLRSAMESALSDPS